MTQAAVVAIGASIGLLAAALIFWRRTSLRRAALVERLRIEASPELSRLPMRSDSEAGGRWFRALLELLMLDLLAGLYASPIRRAGFSNPSAPGAFALAKLAAMAAAVAALYLLPTEYNPVPVRQDVPMVAFVTAASLWFLGDVWLWRRIRRRRVLVESDLPFWLDLHATLVEGGMGFDQALSRFVAETELFRRPLFAELRYAYQEMNLGASRSEALKAMAARVDTEALDAVIAAIVQGEQIGGGIVDTLRAQADMMRNKVFEEARERAQKLPVKMLFPMVVGMLPSLFLVTVAPSFLRLLGVLEGVGGE